MTKLIHCGCVAAALILTGCQTNQDLGKTIGAVTGGVIGSQVGDGKARILFAAGGAVLGGLVGNEIGKFLDERDKEKMEVATADTITTGKPSTWTNPDTNVRGTTRVVETRTVKKPVKVKVLKDRVEKVPPLDIIGATYAANSVANVRGGPSTDYKTVGQLKNEQPVTVVGKVKDAEWFLISEGGIGTGFTYAPLLDPAPEVQQASSQEAAPEGDVVENEVEATQECREIEQSVTLPDGAVKTDTITACKSPEGWQSQTS